MRAPTYSDDAIRAAAEKLRAAGRGVTAFAVREVLGGGNYRRIQTIIDELSQEWRPPPIKLPPQLDEVARQLRSEVTAALERSAALLWQEAVSAADGRVVLLQQELDQLQASHGQEREQAFRELDRLTHELEHERQSAEVDRRKMDEAARQRQIAEQAAAEIRGELNALQRVLEQRERELEDVRAEMARSKGALEAERALRLASGTAGARKRTR